MQGVYIVYSDVAPSVMRHLAEVEHDEKPGSKNEKKKKKEKKKKEKKSGEGEWYADR